MLLKDEPNPVLVSHYRLSDFGQATISALARPRTWYRAI